MRSFNIGSGTSIEVLEDYCFNNTQLEEFILPSPTTIGKFVFKNCKHLSHVDLTPRSSSNNKRNLQSSESYTIPTGLFDDCTSLRNISIHATVNNISDYAFRNCNNIEYYIPDSVVHVGISCFENCYKIYNVPQPITHFGNNSFRSTYIKGPLVIPPSTDFIGSSSFTNTSVYIVIYCGIHDFSRSLLAFENDAISIVTYSYDYVSFCGLRAHHSPSHTCSDLLRTNFAGVEGLRHNIHGNNIIDGVLLFSSVYNLGLW
ncbi:leucine-rich repeats (6 copies)-containing protein [Trichomonas vaginalis G3]|uniref:leucine-rich repeats (6 copies)-containing protein n=1 Tax=Trichomonas vaginalis (strain ATCC PRA-98 / G3) TaxID=412133 RepID=UPI0021E5570E|nr:leucine-rich repeats (6 copies)-containing protein [Trichomonas vaginalis G3]KAI5537649.1 leucine-rich repeats (6 copies)-containing protein [Trichomonas vaginalis G3]